MICTACKYAPLELLAGCGETAIRLDPAPAEFSCAESCGHPNLCGFAKAVIEETMSRRPDVLLLTDCCDAMRRIYDVLAHQQAAGRLYLLPLPHRNDDAAVGRFAQTLADFAQTYARDSGRPFDEALAQQAWRQAAQRPFALPEQPYVLLTGAHAGARLLARAQAAAGSLPVVDATCSGNRSLAPDDGAGDFWTRYARSLLRQAVPCSRMCSIQGRPMGDGNCRGVVHHTVKFCDYYGAEAATLQRQASCPLLRIETDGSGTSGGQLDTRLEAFMETIGVKKKAAPAAAHGGDYVAGVDSGSAMTKAVILDRQANITASCILPTGSGVADGAKNALDRALAQAGLTRDALALVVTTGYGRATVGLGDSAVTEITCHARGAHYLYPAARTIIDIGGQDSKAIRIDGKGNVLAFAMNDKCAAGTGRFLEMQARALDLTLEAMCREGQNWHSEITISSTCTVFAESEVVSLVAQNVPPADIIHGLNRSVAARTATLLARVNPEGPYAMTGGVAQNQGVVKCLEEKLGAPLLVSPSAQLCGALGAALIALEQLPPRE